MPNTEGGHRSFPSPHASQYNQLTSVYEYSTKQQHISCNQDTNSANIVHQQHKHNTNVQHFTNNVTPFQHKMQPNNNVQANQETHATNQATGTSRHINGFSYPSNSYLNAGVPGTARSGSFNHSASTTNSCDRNLIRTRALQQPYRSSVLNRSDKVCHSAKRCAKLGCSYA